MNEWMFWTTHSTALLRYSKQADKLLDGNLSQCTCMAKTNLALELQHIDDCAACYMILEFGVRKWWR